MKRYGKRRKSKRWREKSMRKLRAKGY